METLEGRMQAFEADMNREEIEKNEKVLEEFEGRIEKGRNEGFFFKNLREKAPQAKTEAKTEAKAETQKLREITKESAGSKVWRNMHPGLMSLLAISIADALFAAKEVEWWKVAALVFIFMCLLAQFIYEQSLHMFNNPATAEFNNLPYRVIECSDMANVSTRLFFQIWSAIFQPLFRKTLENLQEDLA